VKTPSFLSSQPLGADEGPADGTTLGTLVGPADGLPEGATDGPVEGATEGPVEGLLEGATDGTSVDGAALAAAHMPTSDVTVAFWSATAV
jgi:hypothetical protein